MPKSGSLLRAGASAALALMAVAACTPGHAKSAGSGGSGGAAPAMLGARPALHWQSCAAGGGLLCGRIKVPLNYRDPSGAKITLALTEVPAKAQASQRLGILLVNPGGPGASGTGLASVVAQGLSPAVAKRYDIIGFDPRGVGSSVPSLHCEPSFFARARPNYIPANAAAEKVLINRAKMYAADCRKRFGWLLPYLTTANVARDMDQIRSATGEQKLSYLGYSYGTYIGQVYATLFPRRVHRMVLDSTVNPNGIWYADNIGQDYAFQGRMNAFLAWMARYNGLYKLGATPAQVSKSWYAARARLAAHPIGGLIGADEYDDT